MNCGKVRCGPFPFNLLNFEEDRRGIGVGLISVGPVADAGNFCEELALNRVTLRTFAIGDNVMDGLSLCILIMELKRHSPW